MSNKYAVDKHGNKVYLCNYRWVDPDGHIEGCKAPQACSVCGQCSRLDGEHELGHCPGHLQLSEHILGIPGREQTKAKDDMGKRQIQIKSQTKQVKKPKHHKKPVVEHKPRLGKKA